MALSVGDIVVYTANYHANSDSAARGRICKAAGTAYWWVNFQSLGCLMCKETSLTKTTGSAPRCTECP